MKKFLLISGSILFLVLILFWFGGRWLLSFSTAQYGGEIQLAGVQAPVEITFDGKGIPQLWAQNGRDLYFALGFVHASERLFQMELIRRLAQGSLAEILGPSLLKMDRQQRTIGFWRLARRDEPSLDDSTRMLLNDYCAGINTWVAQQKILPPEFVLLNFRPEDWKPLDCLTIGIYQTWFAHALMDHDQQYQSLVEKLGKSVKSQLAAPYDWSPFTVPDSFLESPLFRENFPLRMTRASNSWVVGPQKSVSGAALHASDPHLPINMIPAFWYLAGLHTPNGPDILGVTTPGLPFVLMGHNARIGFAFTVASIDLIDYYREQRNPADSLQVRTPTGYQSLTVLHEAIAVKGRETPVIEKIYVSPHGVVVATDSVSVLSFKWAGFDFNVTELFRAGFELQRAENFEQFRHAVTRLGALDVNWTYSDLDGNIGYQLGAPIPIREFSDTFLQVDGADSDKQWKGYYSPKQTPWALNPAEGWLASCNNQIVSDKWPFPLPGFYDPYRITRVRAHLTGQEKFTVSDFEKIQMDQQSAIALRWKGLLADGAQLAGHTELAEKIRVWDGTMRTGLFEPTLFTGWWEELPRALFEDELGNNWKAGHALQEAVLTEKISEIIDNQQTPGTPEGLADISATAVASALNRLKNRNYGEVCQLTAVHPLSQVKILDYWLKLNRGPIPNGGDNGSLNANWRTWNPVSQRYETQVGPSMRFVLDWSDIDGFTILNNLGQSGNPFSPHYDDFWEMWQSGARWQVPFSKEKVFAHRQSLLTLKPLTAR
jgi:penicillin amidase